MTSKTPENRLLIYLIASEVTSLSSGIDVLKDITNRAKAAREKLEGFRKQVRSATDADPNWTDTDIDLMIIDKLNENLKKKGHRLI